MASKLNTQLQQKLWDLFGEEIVKQADKVLKLSSILWNLSSYLFWQWPSSLKVMFHLIPAVLTSKSIWWNVALRNKPVKVQIIRSYSNNHRFKILRRTRLIKASVFVVLKVHLVLKAVQDVLCVAGRGDAAGSGSSVTAGAETQNLFWEADSWNHSQSKLNWAVFCAAV